MARPPVLAVCFALVALGAALAVGCQRPTRTPSPTGAGYDPEWITDPWLESTAENFLDPDNIQEVGRRVREKLRPERPPPKRSILVLSGGGMFGAYSAGIICGWTETGTRPRFDVVTGVSAGALAAALAFPGPEYDGQLKHYASTLSKDEVYRRKRLLAVVRSNSLADNDPLAERIASIVTPEYLCSVAKEHAAGRRFYVGTTNLDCGRFVIWDMGAIATRKDAVLYRRVLLASAAIPGFFPPVDIPVEVNGNRYVEQHVDGGVTASLFARSPYFPPGTPGNSPADRLWGGDMYIVVAGKLFADPKAVEPKVVEIAGKSISLITYAQARDEMVKLYAATLFTGMNFQLTSIPQDLQISSDATLFDAREMSRMFECGRQRMLAGTAWRSTPPGAEPGEDPRIRTGTQLVAPVGLGKPCR